MAIFRGCTCGLLAWFVLGAASQAFAGEVMFSARDGRVTLVVKNASISDVLAVWEREGKTTIVAREKVQGEIAALELVNEPEASALAIVLRGVTGYIAAKRDVPVLDASIYRCIIVSPAPAPAFVAQTSAPAPQSRPQSPQMNMGMQPPPQSFDFSLNPPVYVPPGGDDNADMSRMPPGIRPQFDPANADPSQAQRPAAQPSRSPVFPGTTVGLPGATVPGATPPTGPGQKPPGTPIQK